MILNGSDDMKKRSLNKDIIRDIIKTKTRFLSIIAMISIGVLVFVGLKVTGPEMHKIADEYIEKSNAADIVVTSTYGLDEDDIELLQSVPGVEKLEYGYRLDLLTSDEARVVRLQSKNEDISLIDVEEGRIPNAPDEILLDRDLAEYYAIGDVLSFATEKSLDEDAENNLNRYEYKVVGFGTSPEYSTDINKGTTNIGSGKVAGFGVILKSEFKMEEYSIARFVFSDLVNVEHSSEDYPKLVGAHLGDVEKIFEHRPDEKFTDIKAEIIEEINDGDRKILDARQELSDAEVELNDAKRELDKYFKDYDEGIEEFNEKILEAKNKLLDAEKEIGDARVTLADGKKTLAEEEKKFDDGVAEYEEGLADYESGLAEYEDGKKKFVEGSQTLLDGEKELADGKVKLAEGEKELADGIAEYEDGLRQYNEGKAELEKNRGVLADSKAQLEASKVEIDAGRAKLDDGFAEYNENKAKVDGGITQAEAGITQLKDRKTELNGQLAGIEQAEAGLQDVESKIGELQSQISQLPPEDPSLADLQNQLNGLLEKKTEMDTAIANKPAVQDGILKVEEKLSETQDILDSLKEQIPALEAAKVELDASEAKWQEGKKQYDAGLAQYESGLAEFKAGEKVLQESGVKLEDAKAEIEKGKREISENKQKLIDAEKEIADGKRELEENKQKLADAGVELEDGKRELVDAKQKIDDGKVELEDAKKELVDGERELAEGEEEYRDGQEELVSEESKGKRELADAKRELEDNRELLYEKFDEYAEESAKAEREIEDAEKDLDDARDLLKILKKPNYTIESRDKNQDIFFFYDSAIRLDIISNVFPVFFFLIALFVSLTTMTRMVDEQRLQIGTLKALGYSNFDIIKKYFIYGGAASIIGGLIGVVIGHEVISKLIFDAYAGSYIFTSAHIEYNMYYSIMAIAIGFLCTAVAAVLAAGSSLKENAAALMRGKPPKSGTRIALERIKPIWNRLSFIQKVTARNMFRYKKRMLMTILGVAGCTGLLFMGIGIQDSVGGIMYKQFNDVYHYNLTAIYDEDFGEASYEKYQDIVKNDSRIEESTKVHMSSVTVENPNGLNQIVSVIAPSDIEYFKNFVSLQNRRTREPIEIEDSGAVINEKFAKLFDKSIGDTIEFSDDDGVDYSVVISGIAENYSGHDMYMSPEYYAEVFHEEYVPNADVMKFVKTGDPANEELIESIVDNKTVMAVVNLDNTSTFLDDLTGTLNIIVYVIIICASILAFVVLYNLNNINISERMRELSTIKVLGFYPGELTKYIYRETLVLTSIGIIAGYAFGFVMHSIILNNLIPDNVMLDPAITLKNFILSAALTMLFSFIVMIGVHEKLKKIDMIEALKAVE